MADAKWSAKDAKATPVAADQVLIIDSADGLNKRITLDDIPLTGNIELKALDTGLLKNTTTTGALSIATASDLPLGIDAVKIADGSVTNTEFQYIGTLSADAQTQLTNNNLLATTGIDPGHAHSNLVLLPAVADHAYSGMGWVGVAGDTIAIGEPVYFNAATGKWLKAQADVDGKLAMGMAATASTDTSPITILKTGFLRDDSFAGFTVAATQTRLYLSATPGEITETKPVVSAQFVQIIGFVHAAKIIFVDINAFYVQVP